MLDSGSDTDFLEEWESQYIGIDDALREQLI